MSNLPFSVTLPDNSQSVLMEQVVLLLAKAKTPEPEDGDVNGMLRRGAVLMAEEDALNEALTVGRLLARSPLTWDVVPSSSAYNSNWIVTTDDFVRYAASRNVSVQLVPPLESELAKGEGQEGKTSTWQEQKLSITDEELAALLDPVSLAALEKMFPDRRWANYAERNRRNGLSVAKEGRGKFNPYRAAIWWLGKQTPSGWDLARVRRTLANNLPARSLGSSQLLTGKIE